MNSSASYPPDWDVVPIKDLGDITSGGTPSRSVPAYWNGTIPWVAPNELTGMRDKYLYCTKERITSNGLAASAARLLPVGALLVTSRATIGSVAIAGVPVSTNQGFKNIIPAPRNDSVFYYYCLKTLVPEMYRRAIGSTFLEISKREFERISVPRPQKPEQTAIAAVLDTVDESIRQTAAVIEKLKKIKAGLLHDLLTRGIDENGQLRDPVRHPEQFKDSPLGKVPKAWEIRPLRTLSEIRFSGVDKKSYPGEQSVRLCNYVDAYNNENLSGSETHFMVATASLAERAQFSLRCGDIVVTKDSETPDDIGIPCVISGHPTDLVCGYHLALIRPQSNLINSLFLAKQFRHTRMIRYFGQSCKGLTRYGLPTSAFTDADILVPPMPEQCVIAAIFSSNADSLEKEIKALRKLTMIKQGLMQDLLQGRVRVPVDIAAAQEQEPVTAVKGKKARETNIYFKRSVLAAEIVSQMHKSPTFGHVKFMKTLYLVEQLAHVALQGHYHRAAAGPLDNHMIRSVDGQMEKQKWFRAVRRGHADGNSGGYTYEALEKAGGHREWFEKYWEGARAKIQSVIDILQRLDTQQCEIIATLYSAWADMLSAGRAVTDDAIITEVLTNWHESKQAITHDRWAKALGWMREKALVPVCSE